MMEKTQRIRLPESTLSRQIVKALRQFGDNMEPVLVSGESGTGRRMIAHQIHSAGISGRGPYTELDIRGFDPMQLEGELFGYERDTSAFSQIDQLGIFEREQGGTVVLYHAEYLEPDFQRQLAAIIRKKAYSKVGGDTRLALRSRIVLICTDAPYRQDGQDRLLPSLYAVAAKQHFRAAPLRMHRRDIPRLVQYYLRRYGSQYGKSINKVDDRTMGMFMNYDWPGNLTELASVIQRAVILGKNNQPLNDQMLLGVPKSEGKWEFNLLRLQAVRRIFTSGLFPLLPRLIVGVSLVFVLTALFFGPADAEENIGITLSWVVGWPLLIFSFFFLARTWCSVCGLSVPGWLGQQIVKPERPTPEFIKRYSGWIMTFLCILLFWIEAAWNAYRSPRLTAAIISAVTLGALLFSVFYQRRVWCRYLCPLGALNALFSMPSILELRSNTHVCLHRCTDHHCYTGAEDAAGCPMFRHPFLVDNNRDCILCGQCVKNCRLHSIHLNLRLAPQELWNQQSPRLEDSILVVSLAAIFYPFAINQKYPDAFENLAGSLVIFGHSHALAASVIFFGGIIAYLGGYGVMSRVMARITGNDVKTTAAILGYGMIPLVLAAFMAVHLEIFAGNFLLLADNVRSLFGTDSLYHDSRIMSRDATGVLQFITVTGGLIASLYATRRIIKRLLAGRLHSRMVFLLPSALLCLSALAYLVLC
jgi:polyferredoxin